MIGTVPHSTNAATDFHKKNNNILYDIICIYLWIEYEGMALKKGTVLWNLELRTTTSLQAGLSLTMLFASPGHASHDNWILHHCHIIGRRPYIHLKWPKHVQDICLFGSVWHFFDLNAVRFGHMLCMWPWQSETNSLVEFQPLDHGP